MRGWCQAPDGCHMRAPASSAPSIALATPMPRPATRSTLTPASASAFRTPAWYAPAVPVPVKTTAVRSRGAYVEPSAAASTAVPVPAGLVVDRDELEEFEDPLAIGSGHDHFVAF